MISKRAHRRLAGAVLLLTAFSPVALLTQPASAFPKGDPIYKFNYNVLATAHIKAANITLSPPMGVFKGGIDLANGQLKGTINIPPTTFTQSEDGIGLVTATASMDQLKPVTGHVNIGNFKVTSTSVFNIHIITMYPAAVSLPPLPPLPIGLPITLPTLPPIQLPHVNLVGKNCMTSQPVSVTISGKAALGEKSTFSGVFTMPTFKNCGAMTTVINDEIPGPGNTFSAIAIPPPDS